MKNCYDLRLMGVIESGVEPVPDEIMALCRSFKDALDVCIQLSKVKRTDANLALQIVELAKRDGKDLKLSPSQFSRIRQGIAHLNGDAIPYIQQLCGNAAIVQWQAKEIGGRIVFETEVEVLRKEVEVLRRMVA